MKKLLIIAGFAFVAVFYSCDEKTPAPTGFGPDTIKVTAMSSAAARAMIQHFKSAQAAPNISKLFKGGLNLGRLDSILDGATRFNIFAAAYLDDYPDSTKRNMPTFILQVMSNTSDSTATEGSILYYSVDKEVFCPPPPMCNEEIEKAEE